MEQEKIWDYFQNDDQTLRAFPEARQYFMVSHLKPGMTALNIGVGGGALERMAQEKGVDIHALDPSSRTIERIRDWLNLGEKAQAGYAQAMPFQDNHFDAVVMSEVLEHLNDEILPGALREVSRVLKPGGFLLASTPFCENLGDSEVVCPDCGKVFHKVGHVQSFDKDRMRRIVSNQGFCIEKIFITTFVDWRRKGFKNLIKSLVRILLARMGEKVADPHVIVIAKKKEGYA